MATYQHNAYGLTYTDIVAAYNGATIDDFSTADMCGQQVIEDIIELKEGELIGYLSESALSYFNVLPVHEVTTGTLSGASSFVFDFIPDFDKDIKVEVTSKCADTTSILDCMSSRCIDAETVTYSYDSTTEKWSGILDRVIRSDEKIVITYSVDLEELLLPSLKSILKSMVACEVGTVLFSDGDNSWAAVTHYCNTAEKWLDKLDGWIPPEFKKLKYLEWNGPFRGIRGNRL